MDTIEVHTERATWRIGLTPESEIAPKWSADWPIMVSAYDGPFHFQEHMNVDQAQNLLNALAGALEAALPPAGGESGTQAPPQAVGVGPPVVTD